MGACCWAGLSPQHRQKHTAPLLTPVVAVTQQAIKQYLLGSQHFCLWPNFPVQAGLSKPWGFLPATPLRYGAPLLSSGGMLSHHILGLALTFHMVHCIIRYTQCFSYTGIYTCIYTCHALMHLAPFPHVVPFSVVRQHPTGLVAV